MQGQLPGVSPILHQGKISGTFDLLASDMAQIEYEGRVMLVLVADIDQVTVKTVKGDQTAFWTFKGADAAIVRNAEMKDQLTESLHLEGLERPLKITIDGTVMNFGDDVVRGPEMVGLYDDEGGFLGFEQIETVTVDGDTGEIIGDEEEEEIRSDEQVVGPPVGERIGPHVRHRDKSLESFLYGKESASV